MGASDRMEMEKVPQAGYKIEGLWIAGLQRSLSMRNLMFPFKLISSLLKSRRIIKKFKPDVAIGTGGYASAPLLKVASGKNIPCLIQEQNGHAGVTNKWLSKTVDTICVAYDGMDKFFPKSKLVLTGNPVRQDLLDISANRVEAQKYFKLQLKYLKSIESHYSVSYTRSSCENNIGLSFLADKKNDSASFYFNSALHTIKTKVLGIEDIDDAYLNHFVNVINANKSTINIANKEYDIALPILYKVLKSSKETKERHIQLSTYFDLAKIFYRKKKGRHSLKYLDTIFKIIKSSKNNKMMVKSLNLKVCDSLIINEFGSGKLRRAS